MVIDNPHDKFLKIAVQVGQVVAGILEFQLSLSALKELDLSSSELQSGSFVNENFKAYKGYLDWLESPVEQIYNLCTIL